MRSGASRAAHRESHLHPTATLERLGNMLEREIVNHHDRIAGRKRRCGVLNVQNINRSTTKLGREREGDSDERRVRQCFPDRHIGPATRVAIDRLLPRYIKGVAIVSINFRQCFDQITGVRLVPTQPGSD